MENPGGFLWMGSDVPLRVHLLPDAPITHNNTCQT
jgi:hypothetical protein